MIFSHKLDEKCLFSKTATKCKSFQFLKKFLPLVPECLPASHGCAEQPDFMNKQL